MYFESTGSYSLFIGSADAIVDQKAWLGGKAYNNGSTDRLYQW
jgi:hypothetical protein